MTALTPDKDAPKLRSYQVTFYAARDGLRWKVCSLYPDGIERNTYAGYFWRWITAERIASAMTEHYRTGFDMGAKDDEYFKWLRKQPAVARGGSYA